MSCQDRLGFDFGIFDTLANVADRLETKLLISELQEAQKRHITCK